jgi:hypothetical protein
MAANTGTVLECNPDLSRDLTVLYLASTSMIPEKHDVALGQGPWICMLTLCHWARPTGGPGTASGWRLYSPDKKGDTRDTKDTNKGAGDRSPKNR